MPSWFRRAALLFRLACGIGIVATLGFYFANLLSDVLIAVGIVIGLAVLMALPSAPKAFVEQRNRIRGLKDGTMEEWQKMKRDSQQSAG